MSDNSIIIIDDCNYYHVRKATQDFLETHSDYSLVFQKYTNKHVANEKKDKIILRISSSCIWIK